MHRKAGYGSTPYRAFCGRKVVAGINHCWVSCASEGGPTGKELAKQKAFINFCTSDKMEKIKMTPSKVGSQGDGNMGLGRLGVQGTEAR